MSRSTAIFFVSVSFLLCSALSTGVGASSRVRRKLYSVPRFQNVPYIVTNLTSDAPAGTPLLRVEAVGGGGSSGRVLYNVENSTLFRVDSSSGVVFTQVPAGQLFSGGQLNFTVMAVNSESDGRLASTVVRIEGNRPPHFPDDLYQGEIYEDAVESSLVLAVLAQDADTDSLTYAMFDRKTNRVSAEYEMFTVYGKTGVIRLVNRSFVFTKQNYTFEVIALNSYGLNDTATVVVNILDKNDHKPVFSRCDQYHPTVAENTMRGQYVVQVEATDQDKGANAEIVYSLVTSPEVHWKAFEIDNSTGRITTFRSFNRDEPDNEKTLRVLVKARDRGSPSLEATCSFEVRVLDVNDNKPLFDKVRYTESIARTIEPDTAILRVSATDEDIDNNAEIVYSLNVTKERDRGYFRVEPHSGIVRLIRKLDQIALHYEFHLRAMAQDRGSPPLSSEVDVMVTVKDSSARPPTFVQKPQPVYYLPETYSDTETAIAHLKAVAPGGGRVYYELVRGSQEQNNKLSTFRLSEADNGEAYVTYGGSHSLDFEKIQAYNLTVVATTDEQASAEVAFSILLTDKNDETPIFFDTDTVTLMENRPSGTVVVTVDATDSDGTSPNNKVSFKLDPDSEESRLFAIDRDSGVISTRTQFDREDSVHPSPFYTITVIAEDGAPSDTRRGRAPNSATHRVIVKIGDENDNAPTFNTSAIYRSSVNEDSDIGTKVFDIVATDPDIDSEIRYEITGGNTEVAFGVEPATGSIFVKNALDYERVTHYVLNVTASDGRFEQPHLVHIQVNNVNDEPPQFDQSVYRLTRPEGNYSSQPLIKVTAVDTDPVGRPNVVYQLSGVGDESGENQIFSINNNGEITALKPLDRDEGTGGRVHWELLVVAHDDGGGNGLSSAVSFALTLTDVNDNAPYIVQSPSALPVIAENKDFKGTVFNVEADDFDDHTLNGPPYTFRMDPAAPQDIKDKFEVEQIAGHNDAIIRPRVVFDREQQKIYHIPVLVADSGRARPRALTGTSMFSVVIGDVNDNNMQPGSSAIHVFNFEGKLPSTVIGRVYVDDPDDWDLPDKTFSWVDGEQYGQFLLDPDTGNITMVQGTQQGVYRLIFGVYDRKFQSTVEADVTVTVKLLPRRAVLESGSLRLAALTAEQFITPPSHTTPSRYARLIDFLANLFGTARDNVEVFGVQNNDKGGVDVRYAAHGSPYYSRQKMDGLLAQQIDQLEKSLDVKVDQVGINDCMFESTCEHSCYSTLKIYENEVYQVQTNTSSVTGVRTELVYHCDQCEPPLERQICLNDGHWNDLESRCECLPGYDGANCEGLFVSLDGTGFAWYRPLSVCQQSVLAFDVSTRDDKALLLYQGPTAPHRSPVSDFIAVMVAEGRLRVLLNLGEDTVEASPGAAINDGRSHRVQLHWQHGHQLRVLLDSCANLTADCHHSVPLAGAGHHRQLNVAAWPLQLGGTQQQLQWPQLEQQPSLTGCVHNLTFGNKVFDLSRPGYGHGYSVQCAVVAPVSAVINPTISFVAIIASCLLLLFLLLVAVVVCRRRRADPLYKEPMDELRDTIINYEDEGGGEKDQTAFDLSVLQVPNGHHSGSAAAAPSVRDFIDDNKGRMDGDARGWPPDDVRNYAYEGGGSQAGSLSSLNSGTTDGDLDFDYLRDMDPRFQKLAEMYAGHDEGEEEEEYGPAAAAGGDGRTHSGPIESAYGRVTGGATGGRHRDTGGAPGASSTQSARPSSMAGESWC